MIYKICKVSVLKANLADSSDRRDTIGIKIWLLLASISYSSTKIDQLKYYKTEARNSVSGRTDRSTQCVSSTYL